MESCSHLASTLAAAVQGERHQRGGADHHGFCECIERRVGQARGPKGGLWYHRRRGCVPYHPCRWRPAGLSLPEISMQQLKLFDGLFGGPLC